MTKQNMNKKSGKMTNERNTKKEPVEELQGKAKQGKAKTSSK